MDSRTACVIRPSFNEMKEKMEQPRKASQQKTPHTAGSDECGDFLLRQANAVQDAYGDHTQGR